MSTDDEPLVPIPPTSPFFKLLHLDLYFPIAIRIYQLLPIGDIIALSRTCKSLSNVYNLLLPLEWDIDRLLSRHVSDPKKFRALMARTNALIGDHTPLYFFQRERGCYSLILYVDAWDGLLQWREYLEKAEGYQCYQMKARGDLQETLGSWKADCSLSKQGSKNSSSETVAMSSSPSFWKITIGVVPLPVEAILDWNNGTTLLGNYLSWNKAYSLFPLYSFIHQKTLKAERNYRRPAILTYDNYEDWSVASIGSQAYNDDAKRHQSLQDPRRPGDKHTWVIPFSTDGIDVDNSKARPDFVIEHAVFSLTPIGVNSLTRSTRVCDRLILKSDVLRYIYSYSRNGIWGPWIRQILRYRLLDELHKLPVSERPDNFDDLVCEPDKRFLPASYTKPTSWSYCDDEIPSLYKNRDPIS